MSKALTLSFCSIPNITIAPPKKSDTPLSDRSGVMGFKSAKLLIATIGFSLGSAASAENLVYYGTNANGHVAFYDADTIRRYSNNTVEVWSKHDASKDNRTPWRTRRNKLRFDCSAETVGLLASYDYRADGSLIDTNVFEYPNMSPIPPGSGLSDVLNNLCP